jgi:hypothetical protein
MAVSNSDSDTSCDIWFGPIKTTTLTEGEAWCLEHFAGDKALSLKLGSLLLEFQVPMGPTELPIALTPKECWEIQSNVGGELEWEKKNVGKSILLKVYRLLLDYKNEEDTKDAVEELNRQFALVVQSAEH